MLSSLSTLLAFLLGASLTTALPQTNWHPWNPDYTPDYVLSATAENVTINCVSRYSVVFNGTAPGPPLHMRENHTTWVRVYNNIPDQNLTVVSTVKLLQTHPTQRFPDTKIHSTGTASPNVSISSPMEPPKSPNGRLHPSNTSTTPSLLSSGMRAPTSTTPMSAFKQSRPVVPS